MVDKLNFLFLFRPSFISPITTKFDHVRSRKVRIAYVSI